MLVLTRLRGERIMIGDNIVITVVSISPNSCKLGIEAPPHVPVHRQEVYEALKQNKEGK